ncbi:hypothetical protein B0T25DRAFT_537253 [Lasiosphaeria hispida]|uniref:Uncharacterized protein n=1 Tax=Lasiosphaeria hispida TaxID=260671 RepID=A0AAJ0HLE9_9PEZI|nr:hypothetical protein B0T25DRAFT_537253 [Lasiosphaeria hispida]
MVLDTLGTPVPLNPSQQTLLRRRFFPPLVLLKSLNDVGSSGDRRETDAPPHAHQRPEEKFQTFLNKLAQMCDYRPKGGTITACAAIQQESKVLYIFASNDRGKPELKRVRNDVLSVLGILRSNIIDPQKQQDDVLNTVLLEKILSLNNVRVRGYLNSLDKNIQLCIAACERENPSSQIDVQGTLYQLQVMIPQVVLTGQKSNAFARSVGRLINAIQEYRDSPVKDVIGRCAAADKEHNVVCWSEFQHAVGRLVAYQYIVETLISAHHIWAGTDLFRNFDVDFLPSSNPHPWPFKTKPTAETAEEIIGRVTGQGQLISKCREHASKLQVFDLDGMIREEWEGSFNPCVHAEVLLLDWLQNTEGGIQPHRFFNNWRYIGTSKPLCRLCHYYFGIVAPFIGVRPTHNNIYYPWRIPDVYLAPNEQEQSTRDKKWSDVMNQMKFRVCEEVIHLLEEKDGYKKPHDSNTTTDRIGMTDDVLSGMLTRLSLLGRR